MKHIKQLLFIFLCIQIGITAIAQTNGPFNTGFTTGTERKATEGEKEAITNAINKYLDAVGIKIGDLNLSNAGDGGKEASGNVSFFGFDNINLKAALTADKKVKSINTIFPEAASITPEKLMKFL